MSTKIELAIREAIIAIPAVTSAGITKKTMYSGYINTITDPKYPCMTFAGSYGPEIRQALVVKVDIFCGIYLAKVNDMALIQEALTIFFMNPYKTTTNDLVIYSAIVKEQSDVPVYIKDLKVYEGGFQIEAKYRNL